MSSIGCNGSQARVHNGGHFFGSCWNGLVSPVRVWFDKLPVMFAQDISMEHLSCPLTPPKTSQMPTKLVSGLFMLLFLLLLPNWLSDRLPELAIGKLARSAKQLRQICSNSLEEMIGQNWQKRESEKCGESESEN